MTSTASNINPKLKDRTFLDGLQFAPMVWVWTHTGEPGPILENLDPYSGTWTCTQKPGPVLGNLDLNRSLVWDLYSGTWTCNWEPGPVLGNLDLYSGTLNLTCTRLYTQVPEYGRQKTPCFWFVYNKNSNL